MKNLERGLLLALVSVSVACSTSYKGGTGSAWRQPSSTNVSADLKKLQAEYPQLCGYSGSLNTWTMGLFDYFAKQPSCSTGLAVDAMAKYKSYLESIGSTNVEQELSPLLTSFAVYNSMSNASVTAAFYKVRSLWSFKNEVEYKIRVAQRAHEIAKKDAALARALGMAEEKVQQLKQSQNQKAELLKAAQEQLAQMTQSVQNLGAQNAVHDREISMIKTEVKGLKKKQKSLEKASKAAVSATSSQQKAVQAVVHQNIALEKEHYDLEEKVKKVVKDYSKNCLNWIDNPELYEFSQVERVKKLMSDNSDRACLESLAVAKSEIASLAQRGTALDVAISKLNTQLEEELKMSGSHQSELPSVRYANQAIEDIGTKYIREQLAIRQKQNVRTQNQIHQLQAAIHLIETQRDIYNQDRSAYYARHEKTKAERQERMAQLQASISVNSSNLDALKSAASSPSIEGLASQISEVQSTIENKEAEKLSLEETKKQNTEKMRVLRRKMTDLEVEIARLQR